MLEIKQKAQNDFSKYFVQRSTQVQRSTYVQRGKSVRQSAIVRPLNNAFSSLSFRGNRGYAKALMTTPSRRTPTYGGILCIKNNQEPLYALVQGRYTGKWSFPKGHSNEGEHPFECTVREVGEETGIDELPEPADYIKVGYGHYYVFNLKEPIPLIPRDKKEIIDTKWVTLDEMTNLQLNADASMYRKQLMGT
jgi:8-oxo-dGTP pyrophosphatase MutT (NUDIX family)